MALAAALALAGCGGGGRSAPAELSLQRQDLAVLARALTRAQPSVAAELAATTRAWPLVANGLPAGGDTAAAATIGAATSSAAHLRAPATLSEADVASLTGAASQIGGLFRSYLALAQTGWSQIAGALAQAAHGSPRAAAFARENAALYIESVYDGHFGLAQIGKKLQSAYRALGGPGAFGPLLGQPQVEQLARFYSEALARLHPHPGVRLGS